MVFSIVILIVFCCSIWIRVPWRLVVKAPSCFLSVVICAACFLRPIAILYISFRGLIDKVILKNSFHEVLLFSWWLQHTLLLCLGIVLSAGHVGRYPLLSVDTSVAVHLPFPSRLYVFLSARELIYVVTTSLSFLEVLNSFCKPIPGRRGVLQLLLPC